MLGFQPSTKVREALIPDYMTAGQMRQGFFSPYEENHGTVVAIAGDDFAVIASDTRLSGQGYKILTRYQPKLFQLAEKTILGSSGCWCDVLAFCNMAEARIKSYEYNHRKAMSTEAAVQMLATMLYAKRVFPFHVKNTLAGLDKEGRGVIYSFDPIGHVEKTLYRAEGSCISLLQPVLDNQIGKKNMQNVGPDRMPTLDEALNVVHDCFIAAAEREIHTGDAICIKVITKNGIEERTVGLRSD